MSANDYDEGLYEAVRDLVVAGRLRDPSPAYGIALQVVHQGFGSLSEFQRYIYETQVEALLIKQAPVADYD